MLSKRSILYVTWLIFFILFCGGSSSSNKKTRKTVSPSEFPLVQFAVLQSNAAEAAKTVAIEIIRSGNLNVDTAVTLKITSKNATENDDYTLLNPVVYFSANQTSQNLIVNIIDDTLSEDDETLNIRIESAENAVFNGDKVHVLTIVDNEGPSPFFLSAAITMDADGNGKIDFYKLVFSNPVNDATVPGYVAESNGSSIQGWSVSGYGNPYLAHLAAAPETDYANDNILYLGFSESSSFDGMLTPDITLGASTMRDMQGNVLNVALSSVSETDGAAPILRSVHVIATGEADLIFSEPLLPDNTDNITNYSLLPVTEVIQASPDIDNPTTVHLQLLTLPETNYSLWVKNVQDTAGNVIHATSNTADFLTEPAVVLSSVNSLSAESVSIRFSQLIKASSAECSNATQCAGIYTIEGLAVLSAKSFPVEGADSNTFILNVGWQSQNTIYTLFVTDKKVASAETTSLVVSPGNSAQFKGDAHPAVVLVDPKTNCSDIRVVFSEPMKSQGATPADADFSANYTLTACEDFGGGCPGINQSASAAVYDETDFSVLLSFSTPASGGADIYTLEIKDAQDINSNAVKTVQRKFNGCAQADTIAPEVVSVDVISSKSLLVLFSEPIETGSAENVSNYQISGQVKIASAILQSNKASVLITTDSVMSGSLSLSVENVTDLTANPIATGNAFPFTISTPMYFTSGPLFVDPFADNTTAGNIFRYNFKLFIGQNKAQDTVFQMSADMAHSQPIRIDADGVAGSPFTAFSNYNSAFSNRITGIDVFYAAPPAQTQTGYLFLGAFNTVGDYSSIWYTTDTGDGPYTFSEIKIPGPSSTTTFRCAAIYMYHDYLFIQTAGNAGAGGIGGRICMNASGCADGGLYLSGVRSELSNVTRIGAGGVLPNGSNGLIGIDVLYSHDLDGNGPLGPQLYAANGGMYTGNLGEPRSQHSDGGIVRSKTVAPAMPGYCSRARTCENVWEDVTPDDNPEWNNYVSIPLPPGAVVTGDCAASDAEWDCLLPANKFSPAIKAIPYMRSAPNGDLYLLRNACRETPACENGGSCDFRRVHQVCPPGREVPQVWILPKNASGAGWIIMNPVLGRTDMSDHPACRNDGENRCNAANTHLSLLEFNEGYLYIGYDNSVYGANIWYADVSSLPSGSYPNVSDFKLRDSFGLDAQTTNQKIFSHSLIYDGGTTYLTIITGDGVSPLRIYRTNNFESHAISGKLGKEIVLGNWKVAVILILVGLLLIYILKIKLKIES